jgi:hypothetical protein
VEVVNNTNFPLKPNERDCTEYFLTVSDDYKKAIEYASMSLKLQGFLTIRSIGIVGKKNQISVITNLLARNILNEDEVACMFSFPGRMQTSTKAVISRVEKLKGHWKRMALFICYKKGLGTFPVITRRIYTKKIKNLTIYSLNILNGEIKELWRNQTDAQEESMES